MIISLNYIAGEEGVKQQSENIEDVVNQVAPEVQTEPMKSRLSRREELEIWQAQKLYAPSLLLNLQFKFSF
jgi:hypothetical protein